jgi:hypothetical protein
MRKIVLDLTLLFAMPAFADSIVKVGDRDLVLIQPAGYCELQAAEKSDARVLQAIRGMIEPIGNQLLAAAAECDALRDWRQSKLTRLKNMTQYQVYTRRTKDGSKEETIAAVKEVCDELRKSGKQEAENMNPSVKERAAKVMEKIEYGKIEMIGVTGEEPGACYVALLQKFRAEDKTDVTQLVTYATTLVRGKWIYFYLFSDYENADSVTTALTYHQKNVRNFMAANRP